MCVCVQANMEKREAHMTKQRANLMLQAKEKVKAKDKKGIHDGMGWHGMTSGGSWMC